VQHWAVLRLLDARGDEVQTYIEYKQTINDAVENGVAASRFQTHGLRMHETALSTYRSL
jgi:hypothetical protein